MSLLDSMIFEHTIHHKLWTYLIDHPEASKEDWPGWDNYPHLDISLLDEANYCMCCYFNLQWEKLINDNVRHPPIKVGCLYCPVIWPNDRCMSGYSDGVYGAYHHCKDPILRSEYAKIIRDLPIKHTVTVR